MHTFVYTNIYINFPYHHTYSIFENIPSSIRQEDFTVYQDRIVLEDPDAIAATSKFRSKGFFSLVGGSSSAPDTLSFAGSAEEHRLPFLIAQIDYDSDRYVDELRTIYKVTTNCS